MVHAGATPTPKPSPSPTKAIADAAAASEPISVGGWLLHNPIAIPIILIVLWVGALYGWSELRKYYLAKGKPGAPLGHITRRVWRFMFKEDKRPVLAKIKPIADKTAWLTGTRLYLILLALIPVTAVTGIYPTPVAIFMLVVVVTARARPIFRARWGTQMQMFAVASAECRFPRGAELNPWGYVQIQDWRNLVQPGTTVITYPPAYQSEDRNTREKFERNFNGTVSEENTWNYTWESTKNRVVCKPTDFLPSMANYPGPGAKWNEFVLGTTGEGQAVWDVSSFPHALVCGPTGSGKSVLQRMILFHALAHSDTWKIVGVDPKMVEMGWLKKYDNVLKIALTLEEGVEVVQSVRDEMMRRYDEMSELGFNHFQNLPQPPPALLCMVDETFNFLALEGIKSDEGKERDALHAQGSTLLGEIARLGRAAGIHLVLATQRPDATVLKGELKNNLDCRIAAGRMDTTPSLMVLDSEHATRLPKIKGRGVIRLGGEIETFQGYFAPQEWYDQWKAEQEAGPAVMAMDTSAAAEAPETRKRGFGFKGIAAKAAAAAERRSQSLDGAPEGGAAGLGEWADADLLGGAQVDGLDGLDETNALDIQGYDDLDVGGDIDGPGANFDGPPEPVGGPGPDFNFDDLFGDFDATAPAPPPPPTHVPSAAAPAPVVAPVAPQPPSGPTFLPAGVNPLTGRPIEPADPVPTPEAAPRATAAAADAPEGDPGPHLRPTGLPVQRPAGLPTRPPQAS
jgi:hypothetical protein